MIAAEAVSKIFPAGGLLRRRTVRAVDGVSLAIAPGRGPRPSR